MSSHFCGNSLKLKNVYISSVGTVCGPLEYEGPLSDYFDKNYTDYYCNQKSFEEGERKMLEDSLDICLKKVNMTKEDIDFYVGGDLLNQNTSVHYVARGLSHPFIGISGACSSFCLSIALSSMIIEAGYVENMISLISSHNATAERQYRYPIEYGGQKKATATFTATGAVSSFLTSNKTDIRVESITLGKVIDYGLSDPNDMGSAMAPAAYDTIMTHFKDLNRNFSNYDLVVTGDLSTYGSYILKAMFERNHIECHNYQDCGCLLYDTKNQDVFQGGSGCACSALVTMGYLYSLLKQKKYKHILIVGTGALLSPLILAQKETIPAVAHAISLEVV